MKAINQAAQKAKKPAPLSALFRGAIESTIADGPVTMEKLREAFLKSHPLSTDLADMLVWGGAGTRMNGNLPELLRKWGAVVRRQATRDDA